MDLLHSKYLDMTDDENVTALDLVNLIFKECRVSLKMNEDSVEYSRIVTSQRYGEAQRLSTDTLDFVNRMSYIDAELDVMSIAELEEEYKKIKLEKHIRKKR